MRTLVSIIFSLVLVAVTAGFLTRTSWTAQAEDAKTPWKITGQLEEACSCDGACPCWFGNKPTKMTCGGGQVLFIQKGTYGNLKLDGLAVANFVQSPKGKSMMESAGDWDFSYLYVDEKANPEQRKALVELSHSVVPFDLSKTQKIVYVPIKRTIEGKEHKITVGDAGKFHGHLIEGGLGGTPTITDPPGADPIHHKYQQGETTTMTYNDADQDWKFEKSNYMFGTFTTDNVQWEKYSTGLAQKMDAMKKGMAK